MKILHILDERWDSGLTHYGFSLASALRERGHAVYVAALPDAYAFQEAGRRGLAVRPLQGLRCCVRSEAIDVVNAHTGSGHSRGWWAALGSPAALVRTRGDARPLSRRPGRSLLLRRTDAVVAASRLIAAEYAQAYPAAADRVRTVYPGLAVPPFVSEPAGPFRAALVGRLDPVKGQSDFLAAVGHLRERLTDEEFWIAGEAKNTSLEELKALAEKLRVERWVRFTGWVEDAGAFMRSCHAGVIASVGSEALSRACLEWMAQGRPLTATAVGCLPELISTGENGFLVPPRHPRALADCLWELIRRPEARRDMGRRAREAAAARFGLERFAAETERIYADALLRRRGG